VALTAPLRPSRVSAGEARERADALRARIADMQSTRLEGRAIPTLPALHDLLPGGVLREGGAYGVEGSTSLVMAMLAGASGAGSWCAVVGVPGFGVEAARLAGLDLDRLVLVPAPGRHWLAVVAALVDVIPVVAVRPPEAVGAADASRLGARLRQRRAALVVDGTWPQSEVQLRVAESRWTGLGDGHGRLTAREAVVTASGRGGFGRASTARLLLPGVGAAAERVDEGGALGAGDAADGFAGPAVTEQAPAAPLRRVAG